MAAKLPVASLDTNIILRLLLNDVPAHTKLAEQFVDTHTCHVADLALTEVIFVLEKIYHMPRAHIVENIYAVIRNPKLRCNRVLFETALPTYQDTKQVSINDCLLVAYATLDHTTPLATFDKKLTKQYPTDTALL